MIDAGLRFPEPRGGPAVGLNQLLEQRDTLAQRVREIERRLRFASDDVLRLSAELEAIERRRHGGEDVSAAEVTRAEKELAKAQAVAAEPWSERRGGARRALADCEAAAGRFVAANFVALAREVADDAQAACEAVNDALAQVVRAHGEREAVATRTNALISAIRSVKPGEVMWPRPSVEQAVRYAATALDEGGERAPLMASDPREPAQAETAPA